MSPGLGAPPPSRSIARYARGRRNVKDEQLRGPDPLPAVPGTQKKARSTHRPATTLRATPARAGGAPAPTRLGRRGVPGLDPFEAEVWVWMAVRRQDAAAGAQLRDRLLARDPAPMFRQFLIDPP